MLSLSYLFSGRCKNRPLKELAQFGVRRRARDAADGESDGQESQGALDSRGEHLYKSGISLENCLRVTSSVSCRRSCPHP